MHAQKVQNFVFSKGLVIMMSEKRGRASTRRPMKEGKRSAKYRQGVIGNNAVKLQEDYQVRQPRIQEEIHIEQQASPATTRVEARLNMVCTITMAFVIMATLAICVVFLKAQYEINVTANAIESTKKELSTLRKENDQREHDIDNMINLDDIYAQATTRLGMRLPGPKEVFYIDNDPVTYTNRYQPIVVEKESVNFKNVLAYITKGW